jgi:hypothetical protein
VRSRQPNGRTAKYWPKVEDLISHTKGCLATATPSPFTF